MSQSPIRVGFIGLNPDGHWAFNAHIPALKSLGDAFQVVGVANSTPESARRTAEAMGLTAFDSAEALAASPDIDLVVVTVKVPHHFDLVSTALRAGKHVYCEWPLGNGLEEAKALADLAEEKGVLAVVGTQARAAPEVELIASLVAGGYAGRVLSTSVVATGGGWGESTSEELYYLFDAKNGAGMLEIPMAHTMAAMIDVLGPFGALDATTGFNFREVQVTETGEMRPRTEPDQIMAQGFMESGAAVSIHYRGGSTLGTGFLWEINGTEGVIQVRAPFGHAQMAQLSVTGATGEAEALSPLTPADAAFAGKPDFPGARNVAGIYARLAADLAEGTTTAPSFRDAVALHEVLEAIEASAAAKG